MYRIGPIASGAGVSGYSRAGGSSSAYAAPASAVTPGGMLPASAVRPPVASAVYPEAPPASATVPHDPWASAAVAEQSIAAAPQAAPAEADEADEADEPSLYRSSGRPWQRPKPTSAASGAAWAIAFTPLVTLATLIGAVLLVNPVELATNPDPLVLLQSQLVVQGAVLAVMLAWTFLFGIADRRRLDAHGFEHRPSIWWMLLSPLAYLIVRVVHARRESVRAAGPLIAYVATLIAVPVALILGIVVLVGQGPSVTPAAIESAIEQQLTEAGRPGQVLCPASSDTSPGSTLTCMATFDNNQVISLEVVMGQNGSFVIDDFADEGFQF